MAVPSTPASEFCTACGFPLRGPRCEACGVERAPAAVRRGSRAGASAGEPAWDAAAVEALRDRDPPRFVGLCVAAEVGRTVQPASSQDGVGWVVPLATMSVFVGLDTASDRISIDVPVARLADKQRVPLLRSALELCDGPAPWRLCLRDDLLLLRRVGRVGSFSPEALRLSLRRGAAEAERLSSTLCTWFDARPAFTEEQRAGLTWAAAGRSRPLKSFSIPPPGPARPPVSARPAPLLSPDDVAPRPSAGRFQTPPPRSSQDGIALSDAQSRGAGLLSRGADAARPDEDRDAIPDILSPSLAASPPPTSAPAGRNGGPSAAAKSGILPPAQDFGGVGRPTPVAPLMAQDIAARASANEAGSSPPSSKSVQGERRVPWGPALRRPSAATPAVTPPPLSVRPPPMPELELDPPSRRGLPSASDLPNAPADRLCQLLRDAQVLAKAVGFQDRAGTMLLLVRSTVFRAILDHGEALPDAVAHLYRSTAAATRELAQADAVSRRSNALAIAEPALLVMERVASARGQVPEEKPLNIDPLSTAALAREHLGRYLREIERAPADPPLRHFLALGALSELLVRTKLPAKTEQRLREIVAYAQRDGAKPAAIELLMTALTRIVSQ